MSRFFDKFIPQRLIGPQVRVGRRQLYMLPTRMGYVFSFLLLALLMAAANYENGLSYALAFTLASVGIVSMLYTHRNLLGLEMLAGPAPPVFAGQPARFTVCLRNDAAKTRHQIQLRLDDRTFGVADIGPDDQQCLPLVVTTAARGYFAPPLFTAVTSFPVGLLYTWSQKVNLEQRCLVYPKPAESAPPLPVSQSDADGEGDSGRGDDFAGLREYHHGDSPKHVHWKAVARGQGMQTKQFGGGQKQDLWLDWAETSGDTEARLSVLTRWVLDAEQQQLYYGLRLPGRELEPDAGGAHRHDCLKALALYGHGGEA